MWDSRPAQGRVECQSARSKGNYFGTLTKAHGEEAGSGSCCEGHLGTQELAAYRRP